MQCPCVSRLYELFRQKHSSSVQVAYTSTAYICMNIYILSAMSMCVSHLYDFSWNDAMKIENDSGQKRKNHRSCYMVPILPISDITLG